MDRLPWSSVVGTFASSATELPLRIVCELVLPQRPYATTDATVSRGRLGIGCVYVITRRTTFDGAPASSELWVDAKSFTVRRLVLVQPHGRTTVDFETIRRGTLIPFATLDHRPPPLPSGPTTREHSMVAIVIELPLLFALSTGVFTWWYRVTAAAADRWAAHRKKWWRIWIGIAIAGYVVILAFGLVLLMAAQRSSGHHLEFILAIFAAYGWTWLLMLSAAVLGGAELAAVLSSKWTTRRSA